MLGKTKTSYTSQTSPRCLYTHHPAFFPRISWPKRVKTVWPQWLFQLWPQFWINPPSLIGPYVRSERCITIWTGPQISGRTRVGFLSPSRKALTKTSPLPPSHGSGASSKILSASHWKSHNTLTQFYLKDVAWADSELFHLGPVVAAQPIHQ